MTGKDVLTLLLCTFGYDRNIQITVERRGYDEPRYDIHAENKEGDVYEECGSEGLMFHIYNIISYMVEYNCYISRPSENTRFMDLQKLNFESKWWGIPPKYILDEKHREDIVARNDEQERRIKEESERMKPFYDWCKKHNPCNSCTEKVPLTSLPPGWHHDCEICYRNICPKRRHFFDVEYKEELKKHTKPKGE